jgi:Phage capsid family
VSTLADAFGESLRDATAFDAMLPNMMRVPPMTKVAVVTAGIAGAPVNEAMVKPAGRLSATTVELTMLKSVAFVILSRELMKMASAGSIALLRRELSGAVAAIVDETFISSITSGLSAIPSSGVNSATSVRADLRALADAVDSGSASRLYWVTTSQLQKRFSLLGDSAGSAAFPEVANGMLASWPLLVSDGVPSGVVILADAAQLAASALPIELDSTDAADLQLDTAPDSPPLSTTPYVSLWQENLAALRATRYFAVKRLRDTAVAYASAITGIGNSPN